MLCLNVKKNEEIILQLKTQLSTEKDLNILHNINNDYKKEKKN